VPAKGEVIPAFFGDSHGGLIDTEAVSKNINGVFEREGLK
jgi:hypothetical protein